MGVLNLYSMIKYHCIRKTILNGETVCQSRIVGYLILLSLIIKIHIIVKSRHSSASSETNIKSNNIQITNTNTYLIKCSVCEIFHLITIQIIVKLMYKYN